MNLATLDQGLKGWLPQFLDIFTHFSYGFIALLLLLALAVTSIVLLFRRAKVVDRHLQQAIQAISATKDEAEFTEKFHKIHAKLSSIETFGHLWSEYQETLIPPLDAVDDPSYRVYRNTQRPQSFLTPKEVLSSIRPWMDGERLVGLGLIFTFLGLVAALTKAGTAFDLQGDANEIQTALAALLATAGAKFLASIGGLAGSIIQSMFQNLVLHRSQTQLAKLNDLLEQRLSYASVERIAADHYGHAQRQTRRLEELSNDITMALAERIETALTRMPEMMGQEFTKALDPMATSLESVTDKLTSNNTDAISQMVTEFTDKVRGAGQDSMDSVVQQLNALSNTLQNTVGSLADSNGHIKSGLEQVLEALVQTTDKFEKSITDGASSASGELERASASISEVMRELLDSTKTQQEQTQRSIEMLTGQFQRASEDMTTVMQKKSEQASSDISEALFASLEKLQQASSQMSDAIQEHSDQASADVAKSLTTSLDKVLQQAEAASSNLTHTITDGISSANEAMKAEMRQLASEISTRMSSSIGGIEVALKGWEEQSKLVTDALTRINHELARHQAGLTTSNDKIKEASDSFATTASTVRAAAQPLSQAAVHTTQTVDALKALSVESMQQMRRVSDSIESSVTETQRGIRALHETWSNQAEHLKGADKELEQAFRHITSNLTSSLSTLQAFSAGLSKQVGSMLDNLASIVQELSESVDQLTVR